MTGIDRDRVRDSFHRRADAYDGGARVQLRVIRRLLQDLDMQAMEPASILDVGCGTGQLLHLLGERYPSARLVGVDLAAGMLRMARETLAGRLATLLEADAEALPFATAEFDLVVSSSVYQWLPGPERAFCQAYRVLRPGGLFRCAFFGHGTLRELQESYREALLAMGRLSADRTHRFCSAERASSALIQAGFQNPVVSSGLEVDYFRSVPDLLRSLRNIGAGNAAPSAIAGLGQRRVMLQMMSHYQSAHAHNDQVPASYQVLYCSGQR